MKTAVILIVGSLISFMGLLLVALLLLKTKPELFGAPQPSAAVQKHAGPDSARFAGRDSLPAAAQPVLQQQPGSHQDSLIVDRLKQEADSLRKTLDSLKTNLKTAGIPKPSVANDSQKDLAATAKLLDAMNADDAGKILKQMNDTDLKLILAKMKKRQAGKILASLDPARVARILR